MAEVRPVNCGKCRGPLVADGFNTGGFAACPACGTEARVELFPAFFRENLVASGSETLLTDLDSGCYYHPAKKAAVVCEGCGRFLCGLCDVHLNGQHLCPGCIDAGKKKRKMKNLENERTLYDSMALALSFGGLLIWIFTCITAPAALYVAIRHWNSPGSLIVRSKARFVIAALFALVQIAAWGVGIYFLITKGLD